MTAFPKLPYSRQASIGPDVIVEDQKATGSDAGGATGGATVTRTLNTKVYDPNGYATLATNQITLPAGTWDISWEAPCFGVNRNQSWLYNATDAAVVKSGSSIYAANASSGTVLGGGVSMGRAVVTITGSKAFEIRHYTQTTEATNGLGAAASSGQTEVYTRVMITRVA